jgi:hypothetical protein
LINTINLNVNLEHRLANSCHHLRAAGALVRRRDRPGSKVDDVDPTRRFEMTSAEISWDDVAAAVESWLYGVLDAPESK